MIATIMFIFLVLVGVHLIVKRMVSILIFPVQLKKIEQIDISHLQQEHSDLSIQVEHIASGNHKPILAITIEPKETLQGTIVIFNGQSAVINDLKKLSVFCKMAMDTNYRIVGFNYSATGQNKVAKKTQQDLMNDVEKLISHFQLANKEKLFPLIFKGNSLGGAISTLSAEQFHRQKTPVYVWNGRSFTSAAAVFAGYIETLRISGYYSHPLTIRLANLVKPILDSIFSFYNSGLHAGEAYLKIPAPFKHYYIVHSPERSRESKKDDVTIPYAASLAADKRVQCQVDNVLSQNDDDTEVNIAYYWRRREVSWTHSEDAHAVPETEIFTEENISAYQLFCLFATKYVPKHWQEFDKEERTCENSRSYS